MIVKPVTVLYSLSLYIYTIYHIRIISNVRVLNDVTKRILEFASSAIMKNMNILTHVTHVLF